MSYIGASPLGGSIVSEYFSGDGSTTTFNLTYSIGNEASLLVFISGVKQAATTYAITNGQLTFTEAPPTGSSNIELVYLSAGTILISSQGVYTSSAYLANGTGNTYNLTMTGHTANSILVFVNGISMLPITDYVLAGSQLRLTFTPLVNSNVAVRYLPL